MTDAAMTIPIESPAVRDAPAGFPAPRFDVSIETDAMVPMRDGVRLATDLYLPHPTSTPRGTILIRTQYGKHRYHPDCTTVQPTDKPGEFTVARAFAGQGFAVAVQDLRGLHRSEGSYSLARSDASDGFDTLDWIGERSWSNGAVGTYGCSSLGITQLLLARLRHPRHRCAIAQASGGAMRGKYWDAWEGGALAIGWLASWFHHHGARDRSKPRLRRRHQLRSALWSLPVAAIMDKLESPPTDWTEWVTRAPDDERWRSFDFLDDTIRIDTPVLFVNSWHDYSAGDTIREFELFRRRAVSELARESQFLIIGPGIHCWAEYLDDPARIGDMELANVGFDYWGTYIGWFRHWLTDERPQRPPAMPRAQYYVMGRNAWASAARWPLPGSKAVRWYLHSDGNANTRHGDGRLSTRRPAHEPSDQLAYDPADPTPTVGGPGTSIGDGGPTDQRRVELRADVLCYTSDELATGVEVVGPITVVLFVSSDAPDTDVAARLIDVYPDGRALDICRGIQRMRYRAGFEQETCCEPDAVYRLEFRLQATANHFAVGHRIRLDVSSSDFPLFDRNLNMGTANVHETEMRIACNAIHHRPDAASYVELPIVRH